MTTVENDCEDQGSTRISDGCFVCAPDFDQRGKPIRPQLVQRERVGRLWWTCQKCEGSYGAVVETPNARLTGPKRPSQEHANGTE